MNQVSMAHLPLMNQVAMTLTVDEPGTNDTPTVDEKDFIIANTKEKKTRTYLNEENEPVTKKEECSQVLLIQCWWQPVAIQFSHIIQLTDQTTRSLQYCLEIKRPDKKFW
jgi:hypothetical protein